MAGRRAPRARRAAPRSQHFLRSTALAAELVRAAGVRPDDLVVDLGAGTGRLTAPLAGAARRVIAVELDPRLAAALRDRWTNVDVVEGDAATAALPREPFRVVANLPFAGTNAILQRLLGDDSRLVRADVIVDWGVAIKRAVPWPSTVRSAVWGARFETTLARRLPRSCFDPPPSVDAGVLVIRRRHVPLVPADRQAAYARFVAEGFRRGVGRGRLPRDLDAHAWAEAFLGRQRPRTLSSQRGNSSSVRSQP